MSFHAQLWVLDLTLPSSHFLPASTSGFWCSQLQMYETPGFALTAFSMLYWFPLPTYPCHSLICFVMATRMTTCFVTDNVYQTDWKMIRKYPDRGYNILKVCSILPNILPNIFHLDCMWPVGRSAPQAAPNELCAWHWGACTSKGAMHTWNWGVHTSWAVMRVSPMNSVRCAHLTNCHALPVPRLRRASAHMTVEHLPITPPQCTRSQSIADFMLKRGKAAGVGLFTFITYIHELIKNLQWGLAVSQNG